jgi:tRNA(fMet)-specific endonuclease VapC
MGRYLLDTNILVHSIRDDATGAYIRNQYGLLMAMPRPLISVVTEGELRSLVYQFGWGENRVDQVFFLLEYFDQIRIESPELFHMYAVIDNFSLRMGITMGKNDLWIAASTYMAEATLLTTDGDFDHLNGDLLTVERVPLA